MTSFQQTALIMTFTWFALTIILSRRATVILIVGLFVIGAYTVVSLVSGRVPLEELGLDTPASWVTTIGFSAAGLFVTLVYSPAADWLASCWFKKPPALETFRAIQRSRTNLVVGIAAAWVLGGFLEELIARGIVLNAVRSMLIPRLAVPFATGIALVVAAAGAGLFHLYQGPRAAVIISQLSILFGILFVVSGYNLWTVILAHGAYDTIAFIRFANKQSKYSKLDTEDQ